MDALTSILRRTWSAPGLLPLTVIAMGGAWLGTRLASESLGGREGFVQEARSGALLFAGVLVLSLAEPLEVARDARSGVLLLRVAAGRGFALVRRWAALVIATLPTVLLAAWAAGGAPDDPLALLVQLGVLSAAGLALGAWVDRALLVPGLWLLLVAAHLRPWFAASDLGVLARLLPAMTSEGGLDGLLHGALWVFGLLLIADWRLRRVVDRG